jgi:cyclopropane-fatty-acyl-phospholipid synthase
VGREHPSGRRPLVPADDGLRLFARDMIAIDAVSIDAPRDFDAWYVALMQHQFPGSFLPFRAERVSRAADPYL